MVDDVLLAKAASLERCLSRIAEEYTGHEGELATNFSRQDAIVLNLLRACETAIAMAMHRVRRDRLGLPQESREAFALLAGADLIPQELAAHMQAMVGFRNIAVHQYQQMDLDILRAILDERLDDLRRFAAALVRAA
jgi:uncharacterized protein YutE (UPF0331/DUF86 family)